MPIETTSFIRNSTPHPNVANSDVIDQRLPGLCNLTFSIEPSNPDTPESAPPKTFQFISAGFAANKLPFSIYPI